MATTPKPNHGSCNPACTAVVKFMTDHKLPPSVGISSYSVRLPVMGPFVEVFLYNRAAIPRAVSVWGYLVS